MPVAPAFRCLCIDRLFSIEYELLFWFDGSFYMWEICGAINQCHFSLTVHSSCTESSQSVNTGALCMVSTSTEPEMIKAPYEASLVEIDF